MILVVGSTGFLGKRVCRQLDRQGIAYLAASRRFGFDLRDRQATLDYFNRYRPSAVLNCAAFVGGIQFGYKRPAELFHNNLQMTLNLFEAARLTEVQRIVNPISNCAYPGGATVFKEDEFWDGPLHESVLSYGFARKASWVAAWAYARQYGLDTVSMIFSNMYGPEDHFEEERSHALGALIMKMVRAKLAKHGEVVVWGSGKPIREWLHVDDGAEAMLRGLDIDPTSELINIGVGKGISISELAFLIKDLVGYEGKLIFDDSRPDGALHKTVEGSRGLKYLGWAPTRKFRTGVADTIKWYLENKVVA